MKTVTRLQAKKRIGAGMFFIMMMIMATRPDFLVPAIREEELPEHEQRRAFAG